MRRFVGYHETPLLLPYTFRTQNLLPTKLDNFFLSFTDAVRSLYRDFDIQKNDTVLLPAFYCPDTIAFFSSLSRPVFYRLCDDLSVDEESYCRQLQAHRPRIIVQYAFFGFPEKLRVETKEDSDDTLIIIDGAHLLPKTPLSLPRNYFYIDSIRKRTNILGAHLVNPSYKPKAIQRLSWYALRCSFFHALYAVFGLAAYVCDSENMYGLAGEYFEKLDDLIGTSKKPTGGGPLSYWVWEHINFRKIKKHTEHLKKIYEKELSKISDQRIHLYTSSEDELSDSGYMPLFVDPRLIDRCIDFLDQKKVSVYKLWEPPSIDAPEINPILYRSLIALPLTWLTSENDVIRIAAELKNFIDYI